MEYQKTPIDPNKDKLFCLPTQHHTQLDQFYNTDQKSFFTEQDSQHHEQDMEQGHHKGNVNFRCICMFVGKTEGLVHANT